ncbi:hypothetical protein [Pedobacter duraquae]|nr:hypothetical protein [Pedobacter duraquae]
MFKKTSSENATSSSRSSSNTSINEQQVLKKESTNQLVYLSRDSSDSETRTIIWPRGVFKLSPDSGFIGEADRVEQAFKGKRSAEVLKKQLTQLAVDSVSKKNIAKKESATHSQESKQSASIPKASGLLRALVLAVGAMLLIYLLYRKFRRRNL